MNVELSVLRVNFCVKSQPGRRSVDANENDAISQTSDDASVEDVVRRTSLFTLDEHVYIRTSDAAHVVCLFVFKRS